MRFIFFALNGGEEKIKSKEMAYIIMEWGEKFNFTRMVKDPSMKHYIWFKDIYGIG